MNDIYPTIGNELKEEPYQHVEEQISPESKKNDSLRKTNRLIDLVLDESGCSSGIGFNLNPE